MSITKEVEISFEDYDPPIETPTIPEEVMYRVTIPLKPGQITQTQIITPYSNPFVSATLQANDAESRCWISEISSRVVKIKAMTTTKTPKDSAVMHVAVRDGMAAKRFPM